MTRKDIERKIVDKIVNCLKADPDGWKRNHDGYVNYIIEAFVSDRGEVEVNKVRFVIPKSRKDFWSVIEDIEKTRAEKEFEEQERLKTEALKDWLDFKPPVPLPAQKNKFKWW